MRSFKKNKKKIFKNLIGYNLRKAKEFIKNILFELYSFIRLLGFFDRKYTWLKKFKNKYNGKRCFIIATGPSLTLMDIEKLNNEYTFSMNSMVLALEKTDFRPDFYLIQDIDVYDRLKDKLDEYKLDNIFIGSSINKRRKVAKKHNIFPLNIAYHLNALRYEVKYFSKFSFNCHRMIYDGYTVTYSAIQLAVYMGFKEIYLLGADTNYEERDRQHFIEHGSYDKTYKTAGERMIVSYEVARKKLLNRNVKIYNATRGGMLEVFPRVELDQILKSDWK